MVTVLPGCEAWSAAGNDDLDGELGFLLLHGFTGSPAALKPLAEALAGRGYAVELPRLPGHGTRWQELQRTTWRDWVHEAVAGLERLRARTRLQIVGGLSMGGTLALHLAQTRGDDLAGLVVINPSLFSLNARLRYLPVLKRVVRATAGLGNDIAKPDGDEKAYTRTPLKALASFLEFQELVRLALPAVTTPALVFSSRVDHVVEPENGALVLNAISSTDKRQQWLERSFHVATLDHDLPVIFQDSARFAQRLAATAR